MRLELWHRDQQICVVKCFRKVQLLQIRKATPQSRRTDIIRVEIYIVDTMLSDDIVKPRSLKQIFIVTAVPRPLGDDDIAGSQVFESTDRGFDNQRICIDHSIRIELYQIGLKNNDFSFQIESK